MDSQTALVIVQVCLITCFRMKKYENNRIIITFLNQLEVNSSRIIYYFFILKFI